MEDLKLLLNRLDAKFDTEHVHKPDYRTMYIMLSSAVDKYLQEEKRKEAIVYAEANNGQL